MGVSGSISPAGGAPRPDPERVATIRYTIVDEPETCAAFGETPRAALAALNERTLTETRKGDLGECTVLLDHVRDRVAALDPARLEPRRGLAGLFDGRGKRLKAFRAAYASAASDVGQSAADIGERAGALARKGTTLENLWSETRDAIAELDAHISAARSWLAAETPDPTPEPIIAPSAIQRNTTAETDETTATDPVSAGSLAGLAPPSASNEDIVAVEGEPASIDEADVAAEPDAGAAPVAVAEVVEDAPETASVVSLPHPLATRLAALEAVRATAIGRLPLLRAVQNADCRTPAALKQICDGVEAWRADWMDALGMTARKARNVRPDGRRLADATSALTDRIQTASDEVFVAQTRRTELEGRTPRPAPEAPALAA